MNTRVHPLAEDLLRAALALQLAALEWNDSDIPAVVSFDAMDKSLAAASKAVKTLKKCEV